MIAVEITKHIRYSDILNNDVVERKFLIKCPRCSWPIKFRVVGKIVRTFTRLMDECANPECRCVRPDVERMVDQQVMRLDYTKRYKIPGMDNNYVPTKNYQKG